MSPAPGQVTWAQKREPTRESRTSGRRPTRASRSGVLGALLSLGGGPGASCSGGPLPSLGPDPCPPWVPTPAKGAPAQRTHSPRQANWARQPCDTHLERSPGVRARPAEPSRPRCGPALGGSGWHCLTAGGAAGSAAAGRGSRDRPADGTAILF